MNNLIDEQEYLAHVQRTLGYHHNDPHGSSRLDNSYDSLVNGVVGQMYNSNGSDIQEELRYFATTEGLNEHQQQQQHYQQHSTDDELRLSHREQNSGESSSLTFGSPHHAVYNQHLHNHALQAMALPHYQNMYQNPAAVPIPQMVQLSNIFAQTSPQHPVVPIAGTASSTSQPVTQPVAQPVKALAPLQPVVHDGEPPKPRSFEEEYAIIIQRTASAAAKSSNTKYRCLFCNFTFVGGPQKIRVHLTGKRENGTRLSRCENCPEEVRKKLEERMKAPKELISETGLFEDTDANTPSLPPRNVEEHHCIVLSRSGSSNSKSSNTRYKCIYCRFKFVGGPQKIRVHLTGQPEGGTRMAKCSRVPAEVIDQMELRRKAPRPDLTSTPSGTQHGLEALHGQPPLTPAPSVSSSNGNGVNGGNSGSSGNSGSGGNSNNPVSRHHTGADLLNLPPSAHVPPSLAAHLAQQQQQQRMQQAQASHTHHLHMQQQQQQQQHLANIQHQQQLQQHQHLQHQQQIQHHLQQFHQQQHQHQMHQQLQQLQQQHQGHLPLGMLPLSQLPLHLHSQQQQQQQQHLMQHPGQILLHSQPLQQQQQQQLQRQHQQMQMQHPHGAHSSSGSGSLPPHHVFHNAPPNLPIALPHSHSLAAQGQTHGQGLPAHLVLQPFPSLHMQAHIHGQGPLHAELVLTQPRDAAAAHRRDDGRDQEPQEEQRQHDTAVAANEREERRQFPIRSGVDAASGEGEARSGDSLLVSVPAAALLVGSTSSSSSSSLAAAQPLETLEHSLDIGEKEEKSKIPAAASTPSSPPLPSQSAPLPVHEVAARTVRSTAAAAAAAAAEGEQGEQGEPEEPRRGSPDSSNV